MKWVGVAIGIVFAVVSIGMVSRVIKSMIKSDGTEQEFKSTSYNNSERSGNYNGNFNFVYNNINNILEVVYQGETKEFTIYDVYDDGFQLVIGDISTGTVIDFRDDNTWEYPEGALEFQFEDEYPILFILDRGISPVITTLLLLAPLVFAGGVLAYMLNKQDFKKGDE